MDSLSQSPTEDIILTYDSSSSNSNVSLRNTRRNVMAHTRNTSLPASYFNSNSTASHNHTPRRAHSARNLLRNPSGNSRDLESVITEESDNYSNSNSNFEMQNLINTVNSAIDEYVSPSNALSNDSSSKQKQPARLQKSRSTTTSSLRSSPSIRSVHQLTHIKKKRMSRTIQHISSFLQIVVYITPTISFPITVEKTFTIERLARQIEAEYAFKFCGIEQGGLYEPLEVGLLYDVSMITLRFRDLVGDVLEHRDVVNVLNIYEGYNRRSDQMKDFEVDNDNEFNDSDSFIEREFPSNFSTLPSETITVERSYSMSKIDFQNRPENSSHSILPRSNSLSTAQIGSTSSLPTVSQIQNETQALDSRFQAILSNTLALDYFQKFAIKEFSVENLLFWLDVELFVAGVTDIEDNYFEEQQTAVIHAKYIYLTYISTNSPLQVNLSDEIRGDITWPIDDDDIVERNMFDEAQVAIYQLMKGHTFIRFEDSFEWEECARRKELDPEEYQMHEMTQPLERYFRPNMSLMLAVTMALDPSIEQPPVSHYYKEQTLHSTLSQYFPETVLLDNKGKRRGQINNNGSDQSGLDGYFNSENRLTNAQRMKRIKKDRKLQWVFGEKVDKIDDQIAAIPDETLDGRIEYRDDDTNSILSTLSENKRIGKDVWNRKKKVDKLESIFGRGLKDSQLYSQNILKGKGNSIPGTPYSPSGTFSSETNDSSHLQTMNELSAKDRRMLWKKSKKLQVMLGEALDEDMIRQTLTRPVIQSTPNNTPYNSPYSENFSIDRSTVNRNDGHSKSLGSNKLTRRKRISRRASDSMVSPISPVSPQTPDSTTSSIMLSPVMTPPESPPVSPDKKSSNGTSLSYSHTIKGVPSVNPETVPFFLVNKDSKEYRRKKLQKLHQFLGEKVPVNIILGEDDCDFESLPPISTSQLSPPPQSKSKKKRPNSLTFINKKGSKEFSFAVPNTPTTPSTPVIPSQPDTPFTKLSAVDRKRHLHRAVKLQKMFGETPPQNLILSQPKYTLDNSSEYSLNSSIDLHRQSIISLEYLMENDKDAMYELIDYMTYSDDGEAQDDIDNYYQSDIALSAPSTPYALPGQHNKPQKQTKLKGIRKLSHFFGATYGQMFPDQVLGELLVDLEREIREAAKQNEQLDKSVVAGLMGQLEELRAKTGEYGPDFGDEGCTTEGSAVTDDEYSLEGLHKVSEKNRKPSYTSFSSERMLLRPR
ncbi:20279_t:CDS:2 [Funneliformis geosporum]|uniref:16894_t:CDS:1 n=1 Tax=Funneliformis geosporum TaxID=1117311 RepID=A0A9W4X116_9GLOM|nr:16894_t:CDS:2 [Funneliformis geosporum]CAI2184395.1 20279_t:CDS:2 [Funneliformis geosporum]